MAAIDFETANEQRGSPCSLGIAWIEGERVVEVEHHYVRPMEMRFSLWNIDIHGIRPEDVVGADEFPAVLERVGPRLSGSLVVAHNASFDISVLRATCHAYRIPYPEFDYLCTLQAVRKLWPELPSAGLKTVCRHLDVVFEHHDAAEDAYACALVALAAARAAGAPSVAELPSKIGMSVGRLSAWDYEPCSMPGLRRQTRERTSRSAPPSGGPLYGLTLVFTGVLQAMTRREATELTESRGAKVSGSVSRRTDVVVAGPGAGAKLRRAYECGVRVLTEEDWLDLVAPASATSEEGVCG